MQRTRVVATLLGLAFAVLPLAYVGAQTSTGTVRGYVRTAAGAPVPEVQVTARQVETNQLRGTLTNAAGAYTLGGLRPGAYELTARRVGYTPQVRAVRVLVGQTQDIDLALGEVATQLTAVQVTATAPAAERKTSEVATNVTQQQINDLPTPSRNFLDLAALAPGVTVAPDRVDGAGKTFQAGALPAQNINVFIDGASYKNDIINGGVAGQDASRGNPFPRNAVQEFRITTANFKAEYQKASSAIITAVTKSGTNTWSGNAFVNVQNQSFVALDTFSRAARATAQKAGTYTRPDYSRYLLGLSAGGPIVEDKLFFFGSYEGNIQNRQGRFRAQGNAAQLPASVTALNGQTNTSPFRSHLGFAKLTYSPSQQQQWEFTGDLRAETDKRRFGGQFGEVQRAYSAGENFKNTVATGRVKQSLYGSEHVNEAQLSYQLYRYNPDPLDFTTVGLAYDGGNRLGGADTRQDLRQGRLSLRDDFTYTGFKSGGSHAFKFGGNVDRVTYDINKQLNENPVFTFSASNNNAFPVRALIGAGDPRLKTNNAQLGLYAQDDWSPTPRLTLNVGVRWDYETKMFNTDYVTPQPVRDSLFAYRDSLPLKFDVSRYVTGGSDRKNFYGAVQPRFGLSYAVDKSQRTILFGGVGVFYDRQTFNSLIDETFTRQHPNYEFQFAATANPAQHVLAWDQKYFSRAGLLSALQSGNAPPTEVFLLPNDLKPPRSNQFNVGVRHDFGSVNAALTYTGTRSYNGLSFEWANFGLNPDGGCCTNKNIPAYRNVLVANNTVHSWYNALFVQVDRPYRRIERGYGWGAGLAYTLAKAESEGVDLFSFPRLSAFGFGRHEIPGSERHHVVMNGLVDVPWAWGIQASTLITLGSGGRFAAQDFSGPQPVFNRGGAEPEKFGFLIPNAFAYRNVDLRLRKDLISRGQRVGITADLFNAFNYDNFGCFNDTAFTNDNGARKANPDFGKPGCVIADGRRLQLGAQVDF
ncbi:TonB-dependent receptor plug [Gemmatirosa kalamazoonensis]|uniref:TonB-dependent receptor plug n=1 Tax=Gemmatirosa kalamazoonensis TaxID=861299 RepID=W0RDQ9_9BACT|nr:TonB-dependent receptor [Gemmatirosa kalamazoonensis]AHG89209.1 TonB-dependent receptor plug [Gemmatirosa kalamazoonensis]